jgi:hypothetical protein
VAQKETDELNRMLLSAALGRAICTVADTGIADHIQVGTPRSVASSITPLFLPPCAVTRMDRFARRDSCFIICSRAGMVSITP